MINAPPAPPHPHPAFARTVSAFARLGVALPPPPEPAGGLPAAHPTYRALAAALRDAGPALAPLLQDASLLDRAAYELGLFAPLLRAAISEAPAAPSPQPGAVGGAFLAAPAARVVRARWNWPAFLADPGASQPQESEDAWLLYLPPSGSLQVRPLHPLPALLLEACARPLTRDHAVQAVNERVQGDPARIRAMVHAQMDGLCASGLLHPCAADAAGVALDEMRALLLADQAPPGGARSMLGAVSRTLLSTRAYADAAARAPGPPYRLHRLDAAVYALEQLLERVRLRDPFRAELDGYWAAAEAGARLGALEPLLRVLERAVGRGTHALPPVVLR